MTTASTEAMPLRVGSLILLDAATLASLEASVYGPFLVVLLETQEAALVQLSGGGLDALIVPDGPKIDFHDVVAQAAQDTAVLVVMLARLTVPAALAWFGAGVQDLLLHRDLATQGLSLRLRAAIERKRHERDLRTAYATDLGTGLPHQQQFIEHMSQLLALREREPAPMAVLVLRIEGLETVQARLGRDASSALRRKIGVRLRAGVRASDVVASLSEDRFAVLLGSILTPSDASHVGEKLLKSLLESFQVGGEDVAVGSAIGISQYPQDGSHPEALLRRAAGLASAAQAQGRAGFANRFDPNASLLGAANDE